MSGHVDYWVVRAGAYENLITPETKAQIEAAMLNEDKIVYFNDGMDQAMILPVAKITSLLKLEPVSNRNANLAVLNTKAAADSFADSAVHEAGSVAAGEAGGDAGSHIN